MKTFLLLKIAQWLLHKSLTDSTFNLFDPEGMIKGLLIEAVLHLLIHAGPKAE
jgi:hypothetical protein